MIHAFINNYNYRLAYGKGNVFLHPSILVWRIPRTEVPGGLPSVGSHRVGHDWSDLAAAACYAVYPGSASGKEPACQCRRHSETWVWSLGWEDPWRRAWKPTPVFLPGESHGQRSLVGYSPSCHEELDMNEQLSTHIHIWICNQVLKIFKGYSL